MNKTALPQDVAKIVETAQGASEEVPAHIRERMLSRINASVAAGVSAPMPRVGASLWGSSGVWVAAAVVCVLLAGSVAWWGMPSSPAPLPASVASPLPEQVTSTAVAPPPEPAVEPVAIPQDSAVVAPETSVAALPQRRREPPARRRPSKELNPQPVAALEDPVQEEPAPAAVEPGPVANDEDALAAERALLDTARWEMGAGRVEEARASLQEYTDKHPHGRLMEERQALEVMVLAREGKPAQARDSAAAFSRTWPNSVFMMSIQRAVQP